MAKYKVKLQDLLRDFDTQEYKKADVYVEADSNLEARKKALYMVDFGFTSDQLNFLNKLHTRTELTKYCKCLGVKILSCRKVK